MPDFQSWTANGTTPFQTPGNRPINQVTQDLEATPAAASISPEAHTPGGSTPFRLGYVKTVTDVWVDAHSRPFGADGSPEKITETRASARYDNPSFPERRSAVEEGLKHLPNMWNA